MAGDDGTDEGGGGSGGTELLKAGGSSTVYPIANEASSYWNSNPPASDEEYWGPSEYGIRTDERLADYWGSLYGFDAASGDSAPPFRVSVGLSHSGTGLEKLRNEQIDIGNSSAPVAAELSDASQEVLDSFVNHVVGIDAQPIVVSQAIYDAGVTRLTAEQVRGIYTGEIENWSAIDSYSGPDKEIQAIGRAVGSGTDTAFRANLLGDPEAEMPGVDVRKGQNQQVATLVGQSNNALAYMALAFVDDTTPAVTLVVDGTEYEPGRNLGAEGYPLARDLHMYTWEDTSEKEAAFLRMILSDYGQQNFVVPTGYARLPDERQREQLSKLPGSEAN
ncbi:phosphate ABC transporter substrate-binding protein, phot family [Candidatus Halobonum tyrrellensis G22]|uniref:Phosphate ABC transporter substrate-binding protein, phot family n=1 Tax=Candidatus Halobonum tyrrellensis G22 TaxID=1324957 RepID=V4HC42_9EURY|nr:substrate-binding domain-containing protein [Candidatus Halobonum tyrrellensis]ESP88275.1 phosphate ABC transporter substrate-binding protein, phot family [Candidatus Halobonum tyrrellensis G22]